MPTTKPRHLITETDAVAAALDAAARVWPDEAHSRSRLLVRLIELGRQQLADRQEQLVTNRLAAIDAAAGVATGAYGPGYLEELRRDWPE